VVALSSGACAVAFFPISPLLFFYVPNYAPSGDAARYVQIIARLAFYTAVDFSLKPCQINVYIHIIEYQMLCGDAMEWNWPLFLFLIAGIIFRAYYITINVPTVRHNSNDGFLKNNN
jgi:hypothetical protein